MSAAGSPPSQDMGQQELLQHLLGSAERTPCMQLVLDTDWSTTPAGPVPSWPATLQTALSTALTSRFPMLVMAGPELTMVYNDGYAPMLGDRHPAAMGQPLHQVWSDVWPTIAPMIADVVDGQRANYFGDLELSMTRNGYDEQTFFTFSYSPLLDATGAVVGVLDTALETTSQVLAARRLELVQHTSAVAGRQHPDVAAACTAVLQALDGAPDIAHAGIYLRGDALVGGPLAPQVFGLPAEAAAVLQPVLTNLPAGDLLEDPTDVWGEPSAPAASPVARTITLPLHAAGTEEAVGVLVVRTHAQLPVDEDYRVTLRLLAAQVATAVGNARVNADAARSTRLLETMSAAFCSVDREWRCTYLNGPAEELLRLTRDQAVGKVMWDLFPAAEHSIIGQTYRQVLATGQPATFDAYYPAPLDTWFDIRVTPDADGLSVFFLDITDRVQQQQRTELLAQVTAELTGMLDAETAVARLAELVVPRLGDWSLVTVVGEEQHGNATRRSLRDVGAWHTDPQLRPVVRRYADTRIPALTDQSFLARALAEDAIVQAGSGAAAQIRAVLHPGEAADLIAELAPESITVLPMRGRGRITGLLTLFGGPGRAPLTGADLAAAADLAARAGLALDNARLYTEQAGLAATLQRSLLTSPPEPDHAQVVVRYEPAAQAAQVGGDWYDAFLQHDGATMIVIGDVAGHDTAAAAAMGQLRGLLRGIATYSGAGPADVLRGLDTSMQVLQITTLATAAIARFEQTPDEVERGVTRMIWANAGHPPPIVINPDGTHRILAPWKGELLLGVNADTTRTEQVTTLDRGATVLLYTDGLIERRTSDLDDGLARLTNAITELGDATLDDLCDGIITRMVDGRPDDDIALVAVRLHRQDRPRPTEAGPRNVPDGVPKPAHPAR
ncbi:SpoIIE family protein phosphatase [Klenkia sp. PcliD-1-E]|uniref:SpoIIE family protein phosphatase n=1 Tax=Klenkia sp. PcliD-1-E TaxID=2954492 RepID=UPI00209784A7|nr:SpoIIE family protein phosphatase [Klenkia sp. PcliD-1-E]MCO7218377.1 SpoIIE family protein phosphatase [Klenkia sp. PcliD-1-E]